MPEDIVALDFEMPIAELEAKIAEIKSLSSGETVNLDQEIRSLEQKRNDLIREIFSALTPWQRVQLARHPKRPHTIDYLQSVFSAFTELHGDRAFADDAALVGGCAFLDGQPVVVMGQQKGRNVEDSMTRNFGMMHPEGYRKALRLMRLAEKFDRPIVAFIDTPGAYPGIGAEERGQAQAIAENLRAMAALKTPIVSVVIGEGGSGGALGIGVTDRILMMENAWYSVISPEGCAAILFRDVARAADAAAAIKLTAQDLLGLGIIDQIVPEPAGGAHRDPAAAAQAVRAGLLEHLGQLRALKKEELLERRYQKFRKMGVWSEQAVVEAANGSGPKTGKKKARKSKDKTDSKS